MTTTKTIQNPGIKMNESTAMRKVQRLFAILQREVKTLNKAIWAGQKELKEAGPIKEKRVREKLTDLRGRRNELQVRFEYVKSVYSAKLKEELVKIA